MTDIPLREYFQAKLNALEERVKIQREADQDALRLQAQEYERRLTILNNEHARVDKIVERKVDRAEWDSYQKAQLQADFIPRLEFFTFKEGNVRERSIILGEIQARSKIMAMLYSGIGLFLSIAAIIVAFYVHR